ncbi:MAG: PASTA domain-containing protein, partial [Acutalibacteraceae bacterium]
GKLRITGFCISDVRRSGGEINTEIFPGYAAIEQYGFDDKEVSESTDNYAFAACIYRALIGSQPPEATTRVQNDKMIIPAKIAETIPGYVLDTMAEALQIMPEDRLASTEKFKSKLSNQPIVKSEIKKADTTDSGKNTEEKEKSHGFAYAMFALIITVAIALIVLIIFFGKNLKGDDQSSSDDSSSQISSAESVQSENTSSSLMAGEIDIVPNIVNQNLAAVMNGSDGETFDIVVSYKEYSDDYAAGTIISQEPAYGTQLEKKNSGAEKNVITVVVSLGSEYVRIPSLTGMTEDEARLTLLKLGFSNDNIVVGEQRYSVDVGYAMVVDFEPVLNSNDKISRESVITLHINNNETALQ